MHSAKWTPGTLVAIVPRVPRICSGASGLGSNELMCVTPPASQRTTTDRVGVVVVAVAPAAPGRSEPARLNDPTRSTSRRPHDPAGFADPPPADPCITTPPSVPGQSTPPRGLPE